MRIRLHIDGKCYVCGKIFLRKKDEPRWKFSSRKTCSKKCAYELKAQALRRPNNPTKKAKYQAEWQRKKWDQLRLDGTSRDRILKRRYGISEIEWLDLFDKQGKSCAICHRDSPTSKIGWHTDHDKITKKVRGILCEHCNRGLGMFREDITFFAKAMIYMGLHQGVLPGKTIKNSKIIDPFYSKSIQSGMSFGQSMCGYDIRIAQDINLEPKQFSLGSSIEYFNMPNNLVGFVYDKSTYARLGLSLFNTVIEPGWRGYLTLEMINNSNSPLTIKAGDPIAQILFHHLSEPTEHPYDGKYQDQPSGPQAALLEEKYNHQQSGPQKAISET